MTNNSWRLDLRFVISVRN